MILLPLFTRAYDVLLGILSAAYDLFIRRAFDSIAACLFPSVKGEEVAEDTAAIEGKADGEATPRLSQTVISAEVRVRQIEGFLKAVQRMGEPVRLVIDQIQIMSSFTRTMRIDWPPIFFNIISVLDVLNFDFLQLPSTACMSPRISYFTYFLGITLGFTCAGALLVTVWALALFIARKRRVSIEACEKFSASCLSKFILSLSVAYTPIAEAIMGVFGCERIEDTYWLVADLREQCYTRRHYSFYPVAIFFLIFYVFGIPLFFLYTFHHFRIPQTVKQRKRDARLRALAQYAFAQQVPQPLCDVQKLTEENITDEHVDALYTELFRRAYDFRRHATRKLQQCQEDEERGHHTDHPTEPSGDDASKHSLQDDSGASKLPDTSSDDVNFTMRDRQLRPSLSERLALVALRTMQSFVAHAVSTLSGSEAPHVAASQVHELTRAFKLHELLRWSAVHLHAPSMRWAHHDIVDCIEHLYAHLFCEYW